MAFPSCCTLFNSMLFCGENCIHEEPIVNFQSQFNFYPPREITCRKGEGGVLFASFIPFSSSKKYTCTRKDFQIFMHWKMLGIFVCLFGFFKFFFFFFFMKLKLDVALSYFWCKEWIVNTVLGKGRHTWEDTCASVKLFVKHCFHFSDWILMVTWNGIKYFYLINPDFQWAGEFCLVICC